MAHMKYARATVVPEVLGLTPEQGMNRWQAIRTASRRSGKVSVNLVDQASSLLGVPFDPSKFLLTHATIVASVDVYEPTGVKTGSILEDGFRVNRKYGDYRIKLGTDRYINNNLDAWSRPVLLSAYPTFIGGHNFVEHVQVEDLSKGRIIDAAARDIGDSIYVDILIATEKKHRDLVAAIGNGSMSTLSMGCTVDGTICTKCGHWAADETEMCPHIKYSKGNVFFDNNGRRHRIAELCGHESISPHGGVHFIEASWVATPAFTGAVLRNVLEPSEELSSRAAKILSRPPAKWDGEARRKAAFDTSFPADVHEPDVFAQWDTGDEGGDEAAPADAAPAPATPPANESPFKKLEDELAQHITDRVQKRVEQDMSKGAPESNTPPTGVPTSSNESIIKEGASKVYQASLATLVKTASSDAHLVNGVALLNENLGIQIPVTVYRASLTVGGASKYASLEQFLQACRTALGRQPSIAEARTLVRLGHLISRRGTAAPSSSRGETHPGKSQGAQR